MKKFMIMLAVLISVFGFGITAQAAQQEDSFDISELVELLNDRSSEEVEELIAFIKAKLAAGDLATDQDIQDAIKEGEELINNAEETVKQSFKASVSNFFADFGNRIKDFFFNLFT